MGRRLSLGYASLALAVVIGTTANVRAGETVSGEVVDLACYLHNPSMKGQGHRKCAETCAKKGLPMGILTEDGKVFLLLEDHDSPKPYAEALSKAAQTITVEGDKVSQGGLTGIIVEDVKDAK
jgi:hypothetical protein